MFKSLSWDGCHFYQAVRSWHHLPFYWPLANSLRLLREYDIRIKLLIENKLIICALGNLHCKVSREIPVLVQIFLLRPYSISSLPRTEALLLSHPTGPWSLGLTLFMYFPVSVRMQNRCVKIWGTANLTKRGILLIKIWCILERSLSGIHHR